MTYYKTLYIKGFCSVIQISLSLSQRLLSTVQVKAAALAVFPEYSV